MPRTLDKTRPYGTNIGGGGGKYSQDGIEFRPDGTEYVEGAGPVRFPLEPEEAAPQEPHRPVASTAEIMADYEKLHWQDVKQLYQSLGGKWDHLAAIGRKEEAIKRILAGQIK